MRGVEEQESLNGLACAACSGMLHGLGAEPEGYWDNPSWGKWLRSEGPNPLLVSAVDLVSPAPASVAPAFQRDNDYNRLMRTPGRVMTADGSFRPDSLSVAASMATAGSAGSRIGKATAGASVTANTPQQLKTDSALVDFTNALLPPLTEAYVLEPARRRALQQQMILDQQAAGMLPMNLRQGRAGMTFNAPAYAEASSNGIGYALMGLAVIGGIYLLATHKK